MILPAQLLLCLNSEKDFRNIIDSERHLQYEKDSKGSQKFKAPPECSLYKVEKRAGGKIETLATKCLSAKLFSARLTDHVRNQHAISAKMTGS